ncbi:hypothetical protein DCAR_0207103 [Daucus carota subsp. sativus]|uniref:Uncharacterized protein n=1 Tax=Daucus carota subsp. sativus TaxID=79200 RepID=A0A161Y7J9_DAUCS|nr:hypothetical protein DCAR_0207103 [Daucus carota subsp. sativus]
MICGCGNTTSITHCPTTPRLFFQQTFKPPTCVPFFLNFSQDALDIRGGCRWLVITLTVAEPVDRLTRDSKNLTTFD